MKEGMRVPAIGSSRKTQEPEIEWPRVGILESLVPGERPSLWGKERPFPSRIASQLMLRFRQLART
jgi:hypothetical protein